MCCWFLIGHLSHLETFVLNYSVTTSRAVPQRRTISSCSIVTNPQLELFLKSVIVSVFERRSAPADQRRAVASAFRSLTLRSLLLGRIQQKFDDRAAKYLCLEQVTAFSATVRSSTWAPSCLARMQGGVHVLRRSHDAICHFADVIHMMCCQNSKLAAWEVVQRVLCQNRLWELGDRTMLDFRHLSRPPWWMEQRSSGSSTAAVFPRRMSANHCLRLVIVSPVCHVLHIVGPAPVTSSLTESLIFDSQLCCSSFPLIFTREATHVGIVQASAVVVLIHGLENVNGVCCPVCLCHRIVDLHNRSPPAKNDRSVIDGWSRFRSCTLNGAPAEMTASMASSITCSCLYEYSRSATLHNN